MDYIARFRNLSMHDVDTVGGKNASLGEMLSNLGGKGVRVPDGFATTADAFREYLRHEGLGDRIYGEFGELGHYYRLEQLWGEAPAQAVAAAQDLADDLEQQVEDLVGRVGEIGVGEGFGIGCGDSGVWLPHPNVHDDVRVGIGDDLHDAASIGRIHEVEGAALQPATWWVGVEPDDRADPGLLLEERPDE